MRPFEPPLLVEVRGGDRGRSNPFYEDVRAASWEKIRGFLLKGYPPEIIGRVLQQRMLLACHGSDTWWVLASSVYLISVGFPEQRLAVEAGMHRALRHLLATYADPVRDAYQNALNSVVRARLDQQQDREREFMREFACMKFDLEETKARLTALEYGQNQTGGLLRTQRALDTPERYYSSVYSRATSNMPPDRDFQHITSNGGSRRGDSRSSAMFDTPQRNTQNGGSRLGDGYPNSILQVPQLNYYNGGNRPYQQNLPDGGSRRSEGRSAADLDNRTVRPQDSASQAPTQVYRGQNTRSEMSEREKGRDKAASWLSLQPSPSSVGRGGYVAQGPPAQAAREAQYQNHRTTAIDAARRYEAQAGRASREATAGVNDSKTLKTEYTITRADIHAEERRRNNAYYGQTGGVRYMG